MPKSIGTLYKESRLIAKTINRIVVEPDRVELTDWHTEAQLLASLGGSCLSSTTLLVQGKHVPTYGFDGRCYGFLFDAEKCTIYDVSSTDSNSNRISKLEKRRQRKGVDLLSSNNLGIKTLDQLSEEVSHGKDGQMNEILLDAWKSSCVGLFVRKIDLTPANPLGLKHYYQSLLEIALIQKYLIQVFDFPSDFKIIQYDEKNGKLFTFPQMAELKHYARMQGVSEKYYPELFRLLDDHYCFQARKPPITLKEYLAGFESADLGQFIDKIIENLLIQYEPFDARKLNKTSILSELVCPITGIGESIILDIIEQYRDNYEIKASIITVRENHFTFFAERVSENEGPTLPPINSPISKNSC
ncbi:hypothetical protein EP47_01310 [Legionella norrlandica]|uniref:Uncharacterized protein n=1 Tax=Legionella norrlandica TaxID=1498499 RepID=A0A0A2SP85_9GAMM|nr:hypothetical protein [Legionella norrlandica]KGP62572.1 hypothetical protein EP47_01310 [Legionella norrlandica]